VSAFCASARSTTRRRPGGWRRRGATTYSPSFVPAPPSSPRSPDTTRGGRSSTTGRSSIPRPSYPSPIGRCRSRIRWRSPPARWSEPNAAIRTGGGSSAGTSRRSTIEAAIPGRSNGSWTRSPRAPECSRAPIPPSAGRCSTLTCWKPTSTGFSSSTRSRSRCATPGTGGRADRWRPGTGRRSSGGGTRTKRGRANRGSRSRDRSRRGRSDSIGSRSRSRPACSREPGGRRRKRSRRRGEAGAT